MFRYLIPRMIKASPIIIFIILFSFLFLLY
nr:MAG TPA: hypothetical protein [Caudoviricetes sp.]DAY12299.1 MAG TPA: hypothetical protein [Caudoviricetes sp.]